MNLDEYKQLNHEQREALKSKAKTPEEEIVLESTITAFRAEMKSQVEDFEVTGDTQVNQIIQSVDLRDKNVVEEVKSDLDINKKIEDLNKKVEKLHNKTVLNLGFSQEDLDFLSKKYGIKISNENIRKYPKSSFEYLTHILKDKLSGKKKYYDKEVESLIEVSKKRELEHKFFYKGQEDNLELSKKKWIDDMIVGKDIFGYKYGNLLETTNGYHDYAKLLKQALGEKDFRVDYIKGAPNCYGGTNWININPDLFTNNENSKDSNERLFYHYAKMEGNELAFVHTVLHEGTHAVMFHKINNPKTPEELEARDVLYSIYSYVVSRAKEYGNAGDFYGLTNLDEFCAEYYTAGSIRNLVEKIESDHSNENFNHKNDYPEKMAQPEIRKNVAQIKRIFIKRTPSTKIYSVEKLSKTIEDCVKKLIGSSLEYYLKDGAIDGMILNFAANFLAKSKK